jgi:Domain of unknown function (DUF4261)
MSHMAFILLREHEPPEPAAIIRALNKRHPELSSIIRESPPVAGGNPYNSIFLFGERLVAILSIGAPLPYDANVINRVKRVWGDAPEAFQSHRAHLSVSLLGKDRSLEAARILTAVVGAILETVQGAMGVLWNTSIAQPASVWKEASTRSFDPYPDFPMSLWFNINPFQYEAGVGALTFGLAPFIGCEVEFEGGDLDLAVVVNRVAGLSAYLLEKGDAVKDGDTVGVSDAERIKVHRVNSRRFGGMPVLTAHPLQSSGRAAP